MSDLNPLAFSNVACPEWDMDRVIAAAGEYGYQGVELRSFGAGSPLLASDPAMSDPDKVRHQFESAGIEISCLATSVAVHHKSRPAAREAITVAKSFIDLAVALGCPRIRSFGYQIYPGAQRFNSVKRIAERYAELGDYAEEQGVEILVENAGSFTRAKELWQLTNLANHPLIGVCWSVAYAATVGERPGVSVNVLNNRIRYAKVKDMVVGEGSGFVPLGEGTVEVERFVELIRGIGFREWICFEWDKAWLPALADADEVLPKARETLVDWMRVKVDKKGKTLSRREAPSLEVKA